MMNSIMKPLQIDPQRCGPKRRRMALAVGVGIALLMVGETLTHAPAASAATIPTFTLTPDGVDLDAGGTVDVVANFRSKRPAVKWSTTALPVGISAGFACPTSTKCVLTLQAADSVVSRTSQMYLTLSSGSSRRSVPFALGVHARGGTTPTPASTTTKPATSVTTVPTASAAPQPFTLRPGTLVQPAQAGSSTSFSIDVVRNGWRGQVQMLVDSMPSGWRAAFIPTNPTPDANTTLLLSIPSSTPPGDYQVRISGRSTTDTADAGLIVRIGSPRPQVSVQSSPSVPAGTVGVFLLDARSLDDPARPVTLRAEGLPLGVTFTFRSNPVAGLALADVAVAASLKPGAYLFAFVASRGGVESKTNATLTVLSATTPPPSTTSPPANATAFVFTVTKVTPVSGQVTGYGLRASAGVFGAPRGTATSVDIEVLPTGGFANAIAVQTIVPTGWAVTYNLTGPNTFRLTMTVPAGAAASPQPVVVATSSGALNASLTLTANVS